MINGFAITDCHFSITICSEMALHLMTMENVERQKRRTVCGKGNETWKRAQIQVMTTVPFKRNANKLENKQTPSDAGQIH